MPAKVMGRPRPCRNALPVTYSPRKPPDGLFRTDSLAEHSLSNPVNIGMTSPFAHPGTIAGSVLPLRRAEELIATLPGVLSVRIVPSESGAVDEVHVLTTELVQPKQMVRNIESALMAQLGLRVNHRKISIATTLDPPRAVDTTPTVASAGSSAVPTPPSSLSVGASTPIPSSATVGIATPSATPARLTSVAGASADATMEPNRRALVFEDVEVRRSRSRGVLCRVTLSREGQEFLGESEGQESERSRIDLAARAALLAIVASSRAAPGVDRSMSLEGSKLIEAFDREFIFVSVAARAGREMAVLTGSCEVRESAETSAVLAVLDATNRWINLDR